MKELRTATFKGLEYHFLAYEPDDIRQVPGVDRLKGIADHPEGASNATWWTFQDEAEVRERHWHLGPDDFVLDCGPAFGSYTLTAALQGARVWAYEPSLFCRNILQSNVDANPTLESRVMVCPIGVGERLGLFDPDNAHFYALASDAPEGTQLLPVGRIDELTRGAMDRVTMIKLDVEGAELAALRGAVETIGAHKPRLLIEEHEFKDAGIGARCQELLAGLGYGEPVRVNHGAVNHAFYEVPR